MGLTSMKSRTKSRNITMGQRFHLMMFRIFGILTAISLIFGVTMVLLAQNNGNPQAIYNSAIISFLILPIFAISAWFSFRKFRK